MKKQIDLEKLKLDVGNHKSIEAGACIMEMVSYMANEPWSDRPKCACRVLTSCSIRMNDRFDNATRQLLKPLIPLLIGTRADLKTEIKRGRFIAHRMLTVTFPLFTDAIGLAEVSAKLRAVTNETQSFRDIRDFLKGQQGTIRKAADAYAAYAAYAADAAAADAAYAAYAADAYAAYAAAAYAAAAYAADAAYAAAAADAAAAYAAYAAYAADAAAADAAYAAAAAASPDQKEQFKALREQINRSAIETLRLACEIR